MWVGGALAHGTPRQVELERRSLPQPPVKQVRTRPVPHSLLLSRPVLKLSNYLLCGEMFMAPFAHATATSAKWTGSLLVMHGAFGHASFAPWVVIR